MVRVKYRYILVEIWTEQHRNKVELPVNKNQLKKAILHSVEVLHGDYGFACIQSGFCIKMYNPVTRIFVARVYRKFQSILLSSLPFITVVETQKLGRVNLGFRILRLSGTVRGTLKFLIQYDKEKLTEMVQTLQLSSEIEKELTELITKCHTKLCMRRLNAK